MIAFLQGIYQYLVDIITFGFTWFKTIIQFLWDVVSNIFNALSFMGRLLNIVPMVFIIPGLISLTVLVMYQFLGRNAGE